MKKLSVMLLILMITKCYSQNWDWNLEVSSTDNINVISDQSENVYIYASEGNYLKKYEPTGVLLWEIIFAPQIHVARAVVANDGSFLIVGSHEGPVVLQTTPLACQGTRDNFLARFSSEGVLLWVNPITSSGVADVSDLCVDQNDNIYITGYTNDTIVFTTTSEPKGGGLDLFVARFHINGTYEDVFFSDILTSYTGDGMRGLEIETDSNNDIILIMSAVAQGYIDTMLVDTYLPTAFCLKLDDEFHLRWSRILLSGNSWEISKMKLDTQDNIFYLLNDYWHYDDKGYVKKLSAAGSTITQIWKEDKGHIFGYDLDANGNVYIAGYNSPGASFTLVFGIADSAANSVWEYNDASLAFRSGHDIVAMGDKYFVAGAFQDSITLANTLVPSAGSSHFLAVFDAGLITDSSLEPERSFSLFPNPTSDFVHIEKYSCEATLRIYDLYGKNLSTRTLDQSTNISVDFGSYPPGIYFLEISDQLQVLKTKISVVR